MSSTRALIVIRLSRLSDATTSPERQREACEALCRERGWTVVGVAEDLDVSAGTSSPFERPALKAWLDDPSQYDVIVFYRLDRLVRRVMHFWHMVEWAENSGTNLVSATEPIDLSTTIGKVLVGILAMVAEMEYQAISERNSSDHHYNIQRGKWTGGVPAYGYLPAKDEQGDWRYQLDPVAAPALQDIVGRIINGESLRTVAVYLNEQQVPTAHDRFRQWQGNPVRKQKHSAAGLRQILRSPALLGYFSVRDPLTDHNGKPVIRNGRKQYGEYRILRNSDGSPVYRGVSILDRTTYDQLQKALDQRAQTHAFTERSTALLLRVIYCAVCSGPMYRMRGRKNTYYYRCSSRQYGPTCGNRLVRADYADSFVAEQLLDLLGDSERLERVWNPGTDHAQELAEINATLEDLTSQIGTPAYRAGSPQRQQLDRRIAELAERQEQLESLPKTEPGWTYQPTGETFRDYWERLDTEQRNTYLRDMSVTLRVDRRDGTAIDLHLGEFQRMSELLQGVPEPDAEWVEVQHWTP